MLYPVIDIGSNTVKLSVLDSDKIFAPTPVFFKAVPLGLRAKIENNKLIPAAAEELCDLIESFRGIAARLTDATPLAFATASLRGLDNAGEILGQIKAETGISVELIRGEEEAYYSFLGARGNHHFKSGCVVDLGGGSTEILAFKGKRVIRCVSLPFGCLTLTNRFFQNSSDPRECRSFIDPLIRRGAPGFSGKELLLTGGSAKAVLKYKNTLEKRSSTLSVQNLERIREHYLSGDEAQRARLEELLRERYRLIPAAMAVFSAIASFYGKDSMLVCKSGVREGYLYHHLAQEKERKI